MQRRETAPYGIIYQIRNKSNGKVYIGQTVQTLKRRWNRHVLDSRTGSYHINRAIRKYGADGFTVIELAKAYSKDELNEMETRCIWTHDSRNPEVGYNMAIGGEGFDSETVKSHWADPVKREAHVASMVAKWADPEFRETAIATRKVAANTPERRKTNSEAQLRDDVRKKKSDATKAQWTNPEFAEMKSQQSKAHWAKRWAIPGAKEAWVIKMRLSRESKKLIPQDT